MRLSDLPSEILDTICRHLRKSYGDFYQPPSRRALVNLCLTSKKLNQVATPHLYHTIKIVDQCKWHVALAKVFLEKPQLASWVHEIHLDPHINMRPDNKVMREMAKRYDPYNLPVRTGGYEVAVEPNVKYSTQILDFLLSGCQNLRKLDFTVNPDLSVWDMVDAVKQRHHDDLDMLSHLDEVFIQHWDTEDGFDAGEIWPLLSLGKNIRKTTFFACNEFKLVPAATAQRYDVFPTVLELRLLNSALSVEELHRVVRGFPNLELFRYEMGSATVTEAMDEWATSEEVGRALRPLRKSLRALFIDSQDAFYTEETYRPLGSLRDFEKLENLGVWLWDLSGVIYDDQPGEEVYADEGREGCKFRGFLHKLPKSLKRLVITDTEYFAAEELSRLAATAQKDFPNLEKVRVDAEQGLTELFGDTTIDYAEGWDWRTGYHDAFESALLASEAP